MPRSPHFGVLLVVSGLAAWLGAMPLPARAEVPKPSAEAKPATKEAQDGKGVPRVSLLRIQVANRSPRSPMLPPDSPVAVGSGFRASPARAPHSPSSWKSRIG